MLDDARGAVAQAGLEPRGGDLAEPVGGDEVVRGLDGVAHPELDVVEPEQRHRIVGLALGVRIQLGRHRSQLLFPTMLK